MKWRKKMKKTKTMQIHVALTMEQIWFLWNNASYRNFGEHNKYVRPYDILRELIDKAIAEENREIKEIMANADREYCEEHSKYK
jgi:hypothetical protein